MHLDLFDFFYFLGHELWNTVYEKKTLCKSWIPTFISWSIQIPNQFPPLSQRYFDVDRGTGNLVVKEPLDFESMGEQKRVTFDLYVHDTGVPQKSASALVIVSIENLNDEEPQFDRAGYAASVYENAEAGTPVVKVSAVDGDEGQFWRSDAVTQWQKSRLFGSPGTVPQSLRTSFRFLFYW